MQITLKKVEIAEYSSKLTEFSSKLRENSLQPNDSQILRWMASNREHSEERIFSASNCSCLDVYRENKKENSPACRADKQSLARNLQALDSPTPQNIQQKQKQQQQELQLASTGQREREKCDS